MKAWWNTLPDWVKRILHTGWQAALAAGVAYWAAQEWVVDIEGWQEMLTVAGAAGLSAVKAYLIKLQGGNIR